MKPDYFPHDYNARNDPKLIKLKMKLGSAGKGIYWDIVEMLYEAGGFVIRSEYDRITFELREDYDTIKSIIEDYDLFEYDDEKFWSKSVLKRLKIREEKSEKAKASVSKRWELNERNTNVLPTNNERNTNKKENIKINIKEKEIYKEKEISKFDNLLARLSDEEKEKYKTKAATFAKYFEEHLPEGRTVKPADRKNWEFTYLELRLKHNKTGAEIKAVIDWARTSKFWNKNFLSACKLVKKDNDGVMYYERLLIEMKSELENPRSATTQQPVLAEFKGSNISKESLEYWEKVNNE